MKKEKRELTLKQLERKEKFFAYILPRILIILLFLICAFFAIISAKKKDFCWKNYKYLYYYSIILGCDSIVKL